jgi:protease-4
MRGIVDLGVRPLGKPWLTLFGDAALSNKQSFKELDWGAGLALEPVTGIYCNGKFFHGGAFMLGLSVSLGGAKLSFIPHFDQNSKQTYNTYGVGLLSKPPIDIVTKASMRDKFYLQMDLDKPLKYQRYKLFDRGGMTLMEMLRVLEDAKNDPRIAGVALNISEDLMSSYEMLWEVREKLKEVKDAGKKVLVYLERGGMGHYYLASVADKIMVDPDCIVTMMGFNMGRTFYRNMLDKLGIGVDEWRFFKYKSAAESYSRSSMSEADKEQRKALIDGFYSTMRADICASRGISEMDFDNIVDNLGIITADSLIAYKLADTTGRWDDMKEIIKGVEGKGKGISGIKILTSVQLKEAEWGKPPQIAVIYGLGECAMNSGINARQLQKTIKSVRENKQIKAVVFRADSPGGDILPSDIVTMELKKTAEKKPVIVSQGQVAGSGGYWISMYGDTIVASPWTITGSIGVIGMFLYNNGFGDKLGLTYDHTQVGKHADLGYGIVLPLIGAMIPERNLNTEERLYVETTIKKWYKEFVKKVAEGRNLTEEKVDEIGQGRVWTGTAGKEIGLVDVLGGMEISIDLARKAANIPPERDIEIVELPEKGWFDPAMFAPKLLGIQQQPLFKVNEYDPEMQYLKMIIQANGKPLLMMPPDFYID